MSCTRVLEGSLSDRKRGRSQSNGQAKEARMTFEDLNAEKDPTQWKNCRSTYLSHHKAK